MWEGIPPKNGVFDHAGEYKTWDVCKWEVVILCSDRVFRGSYEAFDFWHVVVGAADVELLFGHRISQRGEFFVGQDRSDRESATFVPSYCLFQDRFDCGDLSVWNVLHGPVF